MRTPEAKRWIANWTDRHRLALEVAGVPEDARPRFED
jgi:hypothetical protein